MPNYLVSRIIIHCMNIESMAGQKFEEAFIHYNTAYRRLMFQYALKDFNNNLITEVLAICSFLIALMRYLPVSGYPY